MAQESAKKALGKITKPTKDGKAKPYTDYDNLEDSMYRAYQTNPEVYTELVGYLGKRGKIPEFDRASWLEMGLAAGMFEHPTEEGGRGRIVLRRPYYEENNRKPALASTTLHELTHAVNKELGNQYAQLMKKGEKNQFTDAYEKLMMSPKREFFGPRPTFLSGSEQLMEKLDPKWRKEESDYRATTNEGLAFAVGSSAGKERDMFLPPAHLDPTLATNLRILVDLANRSVDKKAEKFAKGGEAVNESSVTNLIRAEAQKQGVDPDLAVRIAEQESRLDPTAKNPRSTAAGLFQLLEGTRKELGGDPNKRFDPLENARLGVRLIKENRGKLMTTLGREPEGHESYMAHLFGLRGASTLLKTDPNMPIEEAVKLFDPKRAKTIVKNNKLTGTVGDVIGNLRQKFGVKPVAKPAPQVAPVRKREPEGPVPFTTGFDFVVQAPSYQAALAMASLAELEDEKEDTEVAPEEETQTSSAQMLAGLQMPALQAFAKGGSADKEALVAPPVVVTPDQEPRPTGQARGMLDKLLGARKEVTGTLPGMAADIAASTVNPVYGTAASMADFETARREDDKLGMALSAMGLIPVAGGVIRGGGKMLQRIGKEGAESGGVFGSKEALKSSLGDFPAQVKQSWFDLTDEALYKDPVKMEKVLDDAARLDLFKEEQIKNAKEAIDLFKRKMIDEETLDTIMTRNITGPLTSVWTKLQRQLGHIEIDIPEPKSQTGYPGFDVQNQLDKLTIRGKK